MSQRLIVRGRYVGQRFIPEDQLPDAEGPAELVITPATPSARTSILDLFGKAARLRSTDDIAAQLRDERDEWGEP